MDKIKSWLPTLERYAFWVCILVMLSVTLLQVHATYVFLWFKVLENPALRPIGWSSNTLHALSRLGYFVLGLVWVIIAFLVEHQLHTSRNGTETRKIAARYLIALTIIFIISYLILFF